MGPAPTTSRNLPEIWSCPKSYPKSWVGLFRGRSKTNLVGGFNHLENYESQFWKDDIPYMTWKITKKMFETTNQFSSSPLTNIINHYYP